MSAVRFFDFPKDVSRGEDNRHRVLSGDARGRIVCYLLDRDLWLPDHVEEMSRVLRQADFGHTLRFRIDDDEQLRAPHVIDLRDPSDRAIFQPLKNVVPASMVGHTMEMYRRLPYGWRRTPPGRGTDRHMWIQFLDDPSCRVGSSPRPTVLAFKRGDHPGWSTQRRREGAREVVRARPEAGIRRGAHPRCLGRDPPRSVELGDSSGGAVRPSSGAGRSERSLAPCTRGSRDRRVATGDRRRRPDDRASP